MDYTTPWIIVVAAGAATAIALYPLLRKWRSSFLRWSVIGLVLVLAWVPAAVPGYPDQYAPALIVALFEGVFQTGGNAMPAIRLLSGFVVVMLAVVTLVHLVRARRGRSQAAAAEAETPADAAHDAAAAQEPNPTQTPAT